MKNLLFLFAFATILFACNSEKSTTTKDTTIEDLQEAVEGENVAELASFEYVCNHCKIGSHEAGKCACGMDMVKNAEFKMSHEDHDHEEGHDHDHGEHDHAENSDKES